MPFTITSKSEVLFGEHAAEQAGERMKGLGCTKVVCIYDAGVKDAGIVDPIVESLENAGLKVVHYGGVLADPPDTIVNECGELARKEKVDGIVGVGGGSTLDTAKGVNVLLGNPGKIGTYFAGPDALPHKPGKPLVLIPTTSGTGSEVTYVSVITNTATKLKGGVIGPATIASLAIVDPLLTLGMPPEITAATGMDTFAHALEAYTSAGNNIMSDLLAEEAIGLVARYLPKAVKNGSDVEARTKMSFACLIAGMSFNDAIPHFGHAFAHTLGAFHHIPHGTGCAIAQPGVIEVVAGTMPKKVRRVGELMGLKPGGDLSPARLSKQVYDRIAAFNKEVGIPTLKQLNIKESDLPAIAETMMGDVCFTGLPVKLEQQDVLKVILRMYAL
jgi:alcohol dehydrogenase